MKKLALLLSVAFIAMQAIAANVDRAAAQAKAEAFLKASVAPSGQKLATGPVKFVSERTVTNSSNVLLPVFYIFNTQERFIIVSGEDRSEEILAVGDEPLDFTWGWKCYQITENYSAYSTMIATTDGNIAFFLEDCNDNNSTSAYDLIYKTLTIKNITDGRYTNIK